MRTIRCPPYILEPQVVAHAQDMFAVLSDPAIYEFENAPPVSVESLAKRFERLETRRSADGREQWLNWVVRLPNGRLAGYVQATVLSDQSAFVAYELNSEHWRQGIGSKAVLAVLQELQEEFHVENFFAVLKARNFRSKALLQKLGFTEAGEEQQAMHRDGPDEVVMFKASAGGKNVAIIAA